MHNTPSPKEKRALAIGLDTTQPECVCVGGEGQLCAFPLPSKGSPPFFKLRTHFMGQGKVFELLNFFKMVLPMPRKPAVSILQAAATCGSISPCESCRLEMLTLVIPMVVVVTSSNNTPPSCLTTQGGAQHLTVKSQPLQLKIYS